MDLLELRNQLDGIDAQIVKLYEDRMEICKKVAEYKIETGKKVFDKQREQEKIATVKSLTQNEYNKHGIEELFEQIMSMSRKLQYKMLAEKGMVEAFPLSEVAELGTEKAKVVFQGAEGAYSQMAMVEYFGEDIDSLHVDTFRDAFCCIKEGRADFAVLPIENSTAGIVSEIYDLLVEFDNYIVGEQIIKIEHCLLGVPGTKLEDVKAVYSHPQSLMQSAKYLSEKDWKQIGMQNNAFAAKKIADEKDTTQVAIASEYAGKTYGLETLKKGVNHSSTNATRFIIITNKKVYSKDAEKISLCFELPHKSGSLYHVLSHFIFNSLNMTKIESRPVEGRNWEYRFFVDIEGNLSDEAVQNALKGLGEETLDMKILGTY